MSYKKKKVKKNIINQLKRNVGLIKIVLLRKIKSLYPKKQNMQKQTRNIMQWLRDRSKMIRQNNLKISDWVDQYVEECILNAKPIEILTQYCLSKDLEVRYEKQGNCFTPTKAERKAFLEEIPMIINFLKSNNVKLNWCITLNRSCLDSGRISDLKVEDAYEQMINELIKESGVTDVLLLNWEDDLFNGRPTSDLSVQNNLSQFVSDEAFRIEFDRHAAWVRNDAGLDQTNSQIETDLKFQIACEAEEGRFLVSNTSPFSNGQFILIPFETSERYVFFEILAPGFKKRVVPVLKPYPWRFV